MQPSQYKQIVRRRRMTRFEEERSLRDLLYCAKHHTKRTRDYLFECWKRVAVENEEPAPKRMRLRHCRTTPTLVHEGDGGFALMRDGHILVKYDSDQHEQYDPLPVFISSIPNTDQILVKPMQVDVAALLQKCGADGRNDTAVRFRDIVLNIARYLALPDVLSLMLCCKRWYNSIAFNQQLWTERKVSLNAELSVSQVRRLCFSVTLHDFDASNEKHRNALFSNYDLLLRVARCYYNGKCEIEDATLRWPGAGWKFTCQNERHAHLVDCNNANAVAALVEPYRKWMSPQMMLP